MLFIEAVMWAPGPGHSNVAHRRTVACCIRCSCSGGLLRLYAHAPRADRNDATDARDNYRAACADRWGLVLDVDVDGRAPQQRAVRRVDRE